MSLPGLLCGSRLTFDLWLTFVPALITPGRLYYPLLLPPKVFNASLSTYCVSSCRHKSRSVGCALPGDIPDPVIDNWAMN